MHTNINSLYKEAVEVIKKKGYEGIAIIYDEFGPSILNSLKDKPTMGLKIQSFVGYCNDSGENPCFFIGISHLGMADYATKNIRKEIEKIGGRFETKAHHLSTFGPETEDLIHTMTKNEGKPETWADLRKNSNIYELVDLVETMNLFEAKRDRNDIRETIIEGCYPLHPITTFCLPYLADKVSQKTRSMFKFFSKLNIQGSLHSFIETEPALNKDGRLNLYTLDNLFDYFKDEIEKSKDEEINKIYKNYKYTIQQVGEKMYLTTRALKSLAVLKIVNGERLKPTLEVLANSLNLNEKEKQILKKNLKTLEKEKEAIVKKPISEEYEFFGIDIPKIGDYIEREVEKFREDFNLVEFLNSDFPKEAIEAKEYNNAKYMNRKLKCEFTSLELLENPNDYFTRIDNYYKEDMPYWGDGLILYLILENDDEIDKAREMLRKEDWKHDHIIYAIPKKIIKLRDLCLELEALRRLTNYDEYARETWAQIVDKRRENKTKEIRGYLELFTSADNLIFISKLGITSNLEKGGEEKLVDDLMDSLFPYSLKINNYRIAYLYESQDTRKGIVQACNYLFMSKGKIDFDNLPTTREIQTILNEALINTGFTKKVSPRVYKISQPKEKIPLKIWSIFEKAFEKPNDYISIYDNLIYPLRYRPFGLSINTIRILLSAVLCDKTDRLTIYNNVNRDRDVLRKYPVCGETIFAILKDPINFSFYFQQITEDDKNYLKEIYKLLNEELEGGKDIFEECVEKLRAWYYQLPKIVRSIKHQDKSIENLRSLIENEELNPKVLLLKEIFQVFSINEELPNAKDLVVRKLKEAMEELSNLKYKIQMNLRKELCDLFEAKGQTDADLGEAVKKWYNTKLSENSRIHTFLSHAEKLKIYASEDGPIIDRMLLKLPEAFDLESFLNWDEDKTKLFLDLLKEAKAEIENYQETEEIQEEKAKNKEEEFLRRVKNYINQLAKEYEFSKEDIKKIMERIIKEI